MSQFLLFMFYFCLNSIVIFVFFILFSFVLQTNSITLVEATHETFTIDQKDADEKLLRMSLSDFTEMDKKLSGQIKLIHENCIGEDGYVIKDNTVTFISKSGKENEWKCPGAVGLALLVCDRHLGLLASCSLLGIEGDYDRQQYDKLNEGISYEAKFPTPSEMNKKYESIEEYINE
ncbi:MAG TPA: hypothetical protein VK250_02945 [Nitrososphaeraceae archaeon]|nr:hypothetical protein [Nitrososphaeraceae archaeon]